MILANNFSIQVNNSWNSGKPIKVYRRYTGLPVMRYRNTADKYQLHKGLHSMEYRKIPLEYQVGAKMPTWGCKKNT